MRLTNILVVDDDKVLLKVLEATLIKAGRSVLCVEDGRTALDKLETEIFDMVITDINMPGGVSGFNLIATIRKIEKLKELPAKAKAILPVELEVTGISEQGITIVSPIPFPINFRLKIDCELFDDVELIKPLMRIAHCSVNPKNSKLYAIKANFIGLNEGDLQKIRRWVMSNNPRIQKAS